MTSATRAGGIVLAFSVVLVTGACGDGRVSFAPPAAVWVVGSGPSSGSTNAGPVGGVATHSDDNGETWQVQLFPSALSGVHFIDWARGWVVGADQVFSTNDGGASWQNRRDLFPAGSAGFPSFTNVAFLDEKRGVIVGEGLDDGSEVFRSSFVFLTHDSGQSWQGIPVDGRAEGTYVASVCFTETGIGLASGDGITLLSSDAGETWKRIEGPSGRAACVGRRDLWLIGAGTGPLYHSSNGGDSWRNVSSTLPQFAGQAHAGHIGFLDDKFGWISGIAGALFVTSDGGESWDTRPLLSGEVIFDLATFVTPARAIAVTQGAGAITDDGGATWRIVGLGAGTGAYRFSDLVVAW